MTPNARSATQSDPEWCTRHEAAELLRVSVATIDRWVRNGSLTRYAAPSGRSRFARADLLGLQKREAAVEAEDRSA